MLSDALYVVNIRILIPTKESLKYRLENVLALLINGINKNYRLTQRSAVSLKRLESLVCSTNPPPEGLVLLRKHHVSISVTFAYTRKARNSIILRYKYSKWMCRSPPSGSLVKCFSIYFINNNLSHRTST